MSIVIVVNNGDEWCLVMSVVIGGDGDECGDRWLLMGVVTDCFR